LVARIVESTGWAYFWIIFFIFQEGLKKMGLLISDVLGGIVSFYGLAFYQRPLIVPFTELRSNDLMTVFRPEWTIIVIGIMIAIGGRYLNLHKRYNNSGRK